MKASWSLIICLCCTAAFAQNKEPEYPLNFSTFKLKLPRTESAELQRIYDSRFTVFYKLPQVWQRFMPSSRVEQTNLTLGIKSYFDTKATYGLFSAKFDPDFHANGNFPWETTIGLNSAFKEKVNPYHTVNFISLPEDQNGKVIPILILRERPVKWIFPPGTTAGEVIYVTHKDHNYVQEIRTRRKSADSLTWYPAIYRPVTDRAEFNQLTGYDATTSAKRHFYFRNPQEDQVFEMQGMAELLPDLDESEVKAILNRPFKSVETGGEVWSPAANQDFHILPKYYCFSILGGVDQVTCANCHRQTQISVRNLVPRDPDVIKSPKRVGNIRGCDGIFSWYPFDPAAVRDSDTEPEPQLSFRNYDFNNNLVKNAEASKDYGGLYKLTYFVQESLKGYELPNKRYLHEKPAQPTQPKVDQSPKTIEEPPRKIDRPATALLMDEK